MNLAYYNCFIRYTHRMRDSMVKFECRRLGAFSYHVLTEPRAIRRLLLKWIVAEWDRDHATASDEPWTIEWLMRLPRMKFSLQRVRLAEVQPRPDLMACQRPGYSFAAELEARVQEREEAVHRGASMEPLLIDGGNMELMDGYVRYSLLCRHRQRLTYAYVGFEPRHSGVPYRGPSGG